MYLSHHSLELASLYPPPFPKFGPPHNVHLAHRHMSWLHNTKQGYHNHVLVHACRLIPKPFLGMRWKHLVFKIHIFTVTPTLPEFCLSCNGKSGVILKRYCRVFRGTRNPSFPNTDTSELERRNSNHCNLDYDKFWNQVLVLSTLLSNSSSAGSWWYDVASYRRISALSYTPSLHTPWTATSVSVALSVLYTLLVQFDCLVKRFS